ncbi:hypothetical protein OG698_13985 [Streptomyces sp. NBC_01003]|uniref:hypothetical protein n=1 Tax=Streptomyces sp. NBC_01003 TaxID=2903714 RepID=UPI003867630C|nr:hypothetical protein OG698_13985 [Streptomyces sp. NBC_01003]
MGERSVLLPPGKAFRDLPSGPLRHPPPGLVRRHGVGASPLPSRGDRVRRHALPGGAAACRSVVPGPEGGPADGSRSAALPRVVDIDNLVAGAHVTGEGNEHGEPQSLRSRR